MKSSRENERWEKPKEWDLTTIDYSESGVMSFKIRKDIQKNKKRSWFKRLFKR